MNTFHKNKVLYLGSFELKSYNPAFNRIKNNILLLEKINIQSKLIVSSISYSIVENSPKGISFKHHKIQTKFAKLLHKAGFNFSSIFNEVINFKPDIIILYNYPAILSLKFLLRRRKNKYKVIFDLTEYPKPNNIFQKLNVFFRIKILSYYTNGLILISKTFFDFYQKYHGKKILIPPLANKNDYFELRKTFTDNFFNFIYIGSPGKDKDDLKLLIESFSRNNGNFNLKIIGFTKKQYLEQHNNGQNISNNIIFLGKLKHKILIKHLINSSFLVFFRKDNSISNFGFPSRIPESLSYGTPVITNNYSDIKNYIINGKNGFILENNLTTISSFLESLKNIQPEEINRIYNFTIDVNPFLIDNYVVNLKIFMNSLNE
jgi:glycosyltransferase involved in cell wall biosynthesis